MTARIPDPLEGFWERRPPGRFHARIFHPFAGLETLLQYLQDGRLPREAALVKRSTVRDVHRVTLGDVTVFVKRDRPHKAMDLLRALVHGPRSVSETRKLQAVAALGILCPRPLACAVRRRGLWISESILITLGLAGTSPPEASDLELWRQVGAHARALHDAGYLHRDLHRGNILASWANGLRTACFLDLQKMWRIGWVPLRFRAAELAGLAHTLDLTGRAALLASYSAPGVNVPLLQRRVEESLARLSRIRIRSRSRRCLMNSTRYRVEQRGSVRVFRRVDVPFEEAVRALDLHEQAFRGDPVPSATILHLRPRTKLTKQTWGGPGGGNVVVKSYASGWREAALSFFGVHRGRRAWCAAHFLALMGVHAPQHLALVERLQGGLVSHSAVVMRWTDGSTDLVSHASALLAAGKVSRVNDLASALGGFVGRLHALGIYHEDLKLGNFLVANADQSAAPPQLLIVDLEAVRQGRVLSWRRRLKNLAQLEDYGQVSLPSLGHDQRRRFLSAYFAANPDLKPQLRTLLRDVRQMVVDRAAHRKRNETLRQNGSRTA